MRTLRFIDANNPLRAWARRIARSTQVRPDVLILQLERRVALLERAAGLTAGAADRVRDAIDQLKPCQFDTVILDRVGSDYDGGYVLPPRIVAASRGVVSIGVGSNNDCDVELASRGLVVHAWDHTVAGLPTPHAGITFHRTGLGHGPDLLPLADIVEASFGPVAAGLTLLLDAEGAEWDALRLAGEQLLARFDVVAVEYHDLGDVLIDAEPILPVLRSLRAAFVPVAVHVNNHGAVWRVDGEDWPDALEVTYVRSDLVPASGRSGNCPEDLLAPCCVDLPDPPLSWAAQRANSG